MKSVLENFFSVHLLVSPQRSSLSDLGGRQAETRHEKAGGSSTHCPPTNFKRSRGCPSPHKARLSLLLIVNSCLPVSRHCCLKRGTASPAGDTNKGISSSNGHISASPEPCDAPAPHQPSTGILGPSVLISRSFSRVSQRRKPKPTVSQGKTCRNLHFRFGATARTRLLTRVSAHASGKSFSLFIPWLPCLEKQGQ